MSFLGGAAPAGGSAGYDSIAYPGPEGTQKTLTRAEFEKLPLVDRVRLLSGGQIRFFLRGEEVSPSAAMGK